MRPHRLVPIAVCSLAAGCSGQAAGRPARAAKLAPAATAIAAQVVGRSVRGRPIRAYVVGDPGAGRRVLVVGCIHGDETAGEAITRELRRGAKPAAGTAWWIVDEFNPDGCHAGTRQNAHGVDLNRNSPWHWRRLERPGGTYYSGTRALSEPESRAIVAFVSRVRPTISIWYHQHARLVDSHAGSRTIERRYARIVGLPLVDYGARPGSITSWQDSTFPASTAFVVELPAGRLSPAAVARHVRAIVAMGR